MEQVQQFFQQLYAPLSVQAKGLKPYDWFLLLVGTTWLFYFFTWLFFAWRPTVNVTVKTPTTSAPQEYLYDLLLEANNRNERLNNKVLELLSAQCEGCEDE